MSVQDSRAMQPGAIGRGERHSGRRLLGRDRRSPARLLHDERVDHLGCRYGSDVRDHQRRTRTGGSLKVAEPAISGGTVIINSGYVQNGMPGNALLAYTVDGK
jgi:hypothetical protein